VIWRIVRDDRHAEELARDVFLTARATLSDPGRDPQFSTWLRQIAVSQTLSFVDSTRPRKRGLQDRNRQAERAGPLLEGCFAALNGSMRAALSLGLEGLGHEEIARTLGLEPRAVRSRLLLAREALNKCLQRKRGTHG
jgi:DNA-directed RNA polymerase specialized sigma24 family protein